MRIAIFGRSFLDQMAIMKVIVLSYTIVCLFVCFFTKKRSISDIRLWQTKRRMEH